MTWEILFNFESQASGSGLDKIYKNLLLLTICWLERCENSRSTGKLTKLMIVLQFDAIFLWFWFFSVTFKVSLHYILKNSWVLLLIGLSLKSEYWPTCPFAVYANFCACTHARIAIKIIIVAILSKVYKISISISLTP